MSFSLAPMLHEQRPHLSLETCHATLKFLSANNIHSSQYMIKRGSYSLVELHL